MEATMNQDAYEPSSFKKGVAKTLNATGSGLVTAWDFTALACLKTVNLFKKAGKAKGMFTKGLATIKSSEVKQIQDKIIQYQRKIQALYFEIGKEGAKHADDAQPLESEAIKKLIAEVKEFENEINRLKTRLIEIRKEKDAKAAQKRLSKQQVASPVIQKKVDFRKIDRRLEEAISKACRQGEFESLSEREIFNKVANDLLDHEMEIKMLAAAELGKMKLKASIPVLIAAADYNHSDLNSEIVNALIAIGDPLSIPLYKNKRFDPKFTVRIACLRGIYKSAEPEEATLILTEGLRDRHPEVRRTAATFIGWRDLSDAVPALIQSMRDADASVRKAAINALSNIKDDATVLPIIKLLGDKELEVREKAFEAIQSITGEDFSFDVHLFGPALTQAVNDVRDWWQNTRLNMLNQSKSINDELYDESINIEDESISTNDGFEDVEETVEFEDSVQSENSEGSELTLAADNSYQSVDSENSDEIGEDENAENFDQSDDSENSDEISDAEHAKAADQSEDSEDSVDSEDS